MSLSQTLKNNKLRTENHASYRGKNEFYGNKDMFKKNCKKQRLVTNLHITLVRNTILEDTPGHEAPEKCLIEARRYGSYLGKNEISRKKHIFARSDTDPPLSGKYTRNQ